jgi:hypothetical protein
VLTSLNHLPFFGIQSPGTLAVAFQAQIDVSCAAPEAPRASLRSLLLALPIGKLLLAGGRCGELAHT